MARGQVSPPFIAPQFPKLVDRAPVGSQWIHEIKFDGYRMQVRVEGPRVTIRTRNGFDWTERFPVLTREAANLGSCIIDGELCAVDKNGLPDFAALLSALAAKRTGSLVFFAFDCLYRGREDLRYQPLLLRKQVLQALLKKAGPHIHYSTHTEGDGPELFRAACRQKLEGIVSKRSNATYSSGKGESWVKTKCRPGMEVVIGGWTQSGAAFNSIIAGAYDDGGRLAYIGKIGTGFSARTLNLLVPRLKALRAKASPFTGRQPTPSNTIFWAEPELVAQVAFAAWTGDGLLRQASFKGLREDKPAEAVRLETANVGNAA